MKKFGLGSGTGPGTIPRKRSLKLSFGGGFVLGLPLSKTISTRRFRSRCFSLAAGLADFEPIPEDENAIAGLIVLIPRTGENEKLRKRVPAAD